MQLPISSESLERQQEGYTPLPSAGRLPSSPELAWVRGRAEHSIAHVTADRRARRRLGNVLCPVLQKLGDWLVCSLTSSQMDVSSGEKGGWCFTHSPQHKNLPRQLAFSFPHAQSGTKLSLGM